MVTGVERIFRRTPHVKGWKSGKEDLKEAVFMCIEKNGEMMQEKSRKVGSGHTKTPFCHHGIAISI